MTRKPNKHRTIIYSNELVSSVAPSTRRSPRPLRVCSSCVSPWGRKESRRPTKSGVETKSRSTRRVNKKKLEGFPPSQVDKQALQVVALFLPTQLSTSSLRCCLEPVRSNETVEKEQYIDNLDPQQLYNNFLHYWDVFPIGPVWPVPKQPKSNASAAPFVFLMRTLSRVQSSGKLKGHSHSPNKCAINQHLSGSNNRTRERLTCSLYRR